MGTCYSYLSPDERIRIERLHCEQGLSVRETAGLIGRDKATVSRELKRGLWFASNENESYRPYRPRRLGWGLRTFSWSCFLYGQPLACSVFYRAFPAQRLFDPRMVVPVDVFAGEAAGLLARTLLPMPGAARTRVFMRPKDPSAAGVVAGCTPSRSWTGPGRTGPSGPAIPATGNDNRGRRETAGRSPGRSMAAARSSIAFSNCSTFSDTNRSSLVSSMFSSTCTI